MVAFFGTFVIVTGTLIALFNGMAGQQALMSQHEDPLTVVEVAATNMTITLFDPHSYTTNGTQLNGSHRQDHVDFTLAGQTDIGCSVFRNVSDWQWNPDHAFYDGLGDHVLGMSLKRYAATVDNHGAHDFVIYWQSWIYDNIGVSRHYRWAVYDLATINETRSSELGYALLNFHLRSWTTSFVAWNLPWMLYGNHFNITVGTGYNATFASVSPVAIIGQLMTFSSPVVPFPINYLIGVAIDLTMAFVAIELVMRAFSV